MSMQVIACKDLKSFKVEIIADMITRRIVLDNGFVVPERFLRLIKSISDEEWLSTDAELTYWEKENQWDFEIKSRPGTTAFQISLGFDRGDAPAEFEFVRAYMPHNDEE